MRPRWTIALRAVGLVGITYEALSGQERASLLVLYASMIGLPEVVAAARARNGGAK